METLGSLERYFSVVTWAAMSFAILLKDSKPAGVTDSKAVEAASRPPVRLVGSNEPRTSISLPKISAMELRYSCSVRRRRSQSRSSLPMVRP